MLFGLIAFSLAFIALVVTHVIFGGVYMKDYTLRLLQEVGPSP